jgi:hypothetical protein
MMGSEKMAEDRAKVYTRDHVAGADREFRAGVALMTSGGNRNSRPNETRATIYYYCIYHTLNSDTQCQGRNWPQIYDLKAACDDYEYAARY